MSQTVGANVFSASEDVLDPDVFQIIAMQFVASTESLLQPSLFQIVNTSVYGSSVAINQPSLREALSGEIYFDVFVQANLVAEVPVESPPIDLKARGTYHEQMPTPTVVGGFPT